MLMLAVTEVPAEAADLLVEELRVEVQVDQADQVQKADQGQEEMLAEAQDLAMAAIRRSSVPSSSAKACCRSKSACGRIGAP